MRVVMQIVFVPEASAQDLWIAYEMGSRLDLRVVCMGVAAILLFSYAIALLAPLSTRLRQARASTQATTKGGGNSTQSFACLHCPYKLPCVL